MDLREIDVRDADGKRLKGGVPTPATGEFYRRAHRLGNVTFISDAIGSNPIVKNDLIRMQVPWMVTLLVYKSKFQMEPDKREYFVYAPPKLNAAAEFALRLWRRWEKKLFRVARDPKEVPDMRDDWPKVSDGIVAEPVNDKFFRETWKYVKGRRHKAAGHPDDPIAFVCLEPEFSIYKTEDFQKDLPVRIN